MKLVRDDNVFYFKVLFESPRKLGINLSIIYLRCLVYSIAILICKGEANLGFDKINNKY